MSVPHRTGRVVPLRPAATDAQPGLADPGLEHGRPDTDDSAASARAARFGWWVLALGFGGFLAWAALAPLDNGVSMPGTVVVTGERQAVDSLGGGVVGALLVGEGETVRAGQIVVRLDSTRAHSEAQSLRAQLAAARAREARLLAERDGLSVVTLPADAAVHAEAAGALALERQLFASRRAALEGELAGIQATLQGNRALAAGLESSLAYQRAQRGMLQEQLGNLRGLAREGYVPRNRLLELERMRAQLGSEIAADLGSLGQARQQVAELTLRAGQRRDAFQQEVRADLAETRVRREQLAQQLTAAEFDLAHTEIRAPASGTVVGLAAHTVGGVVQPGARLMEIVPADAPLIVEGRLPVDSVDKVQVGLPVELMFTAFDTSRTPRLAGTVALLSADRYEDERSGQPYYRLRVEVPPGQLLRIGGAASLRAGMPVEVFVRTGERSLLNYLFKPLLDRTHSAWGDA
ncbi:HlyD family type I secretion periplasmic adaptor subunit [Bordetella petrii]|uniref:HlyD family type I secretion periplasmic adaptor subunit n=1 Tax=Bordetella petrii TaxID=94624 RepID=UPI001F600F30|nr:HlyD family type I secretion periplasmic adaptor subunit [Bordetella petrii]